MGVMDHIFISYSRKDISVVSKVVDCLARNRKVQIWQDIQGKNAGIPYSTKWFDAIEEALYSARGAIIFRTKNWEKSVPCAQEWSLILKNKIPVYEIAFCNEEMEYSFEEYAQKIEEWFSRSVMTTSNARRTWLLRGCYALSKKRDIKEFIPKVKGITGTIKALVEVKEALRVVEKFEIEDVELKRCILAFVQKTKFSIIKRSIVLVLVLIIAALIYLGSEIGSEVFDKVAKDATQMNLLHMKLQRSRRHGKYNPIQTMLFLSSDSAEPTEGDHYYQIHHLSYYNCLHYPNAYFKSDGKDSKQAKDTIYHTQDSGRYGLRVDGVKLIISDRMTGIDRQIVTEHPITDFTISEDEHWIAIASGKKCYIIGSQYGRDPVPLSFSYEDIVRIGFLEGRICGITEDGNVIIWDNPLKKAIITRKDISNGALTVLSDGTVRAVYFDGEKLIYNQSNQEIESNCVLPKGTVNDQWIALDGNLFAYQIRIEEKQTDYIVILDVEKDIIVNSVDTGTNVGQMIFVDDVKKIVTAVNDSEGGIMIVDIDTGVIKRSEKLNINTYNVISYSGGYIAGDYYGDFYKFNSDLKRVGNSIVNKQGAMIRKEYAVSEKFQRLLGANRGGNLITGMFSVDLEKNKYNVLVPTNTLSDISNNCVAISPGGLYAVYGNPSGQIQSWFLGRFYSPWSSDVINESILDLQWSDDEKTLYALGKSGTIFSLDVSEELLHTEDSEKLWTFYQRKSRDIAEKIYRLGLTNIAPEEFDLLDKKQQ